LEAASTRATPPRSGSCARRIVSPSLAVTAVQFATHFKYEIRTPGELGPSRDPRSSPRAPAARATSTHRPHSNAGTRLRDNVVFLLLCAALTRGTCRLASRPCRARGTRARSATRSAS
jgi:hypothetical protein